MIQSMKYILVTGTNGGLGLGICTRLIDDFLRAEPQSHSLTLIFTTRSTRKGTETLRTLQTHLSKSHGPSLHTRIHLRPESVELTSLVSIRALSRKLLASEVPYLNAIVCNAGIGGWSGLNYIQAVPDIILGPVNNTTWPRYKLGIAGLVTERQFPAGITHKQGESESQQEKEEPPIGQIFCANVFGHYMLAHWVMPMLRACPAAEPGRIVWVSSIEPQARNLNEQDIMGLQTSAAYEASKRLTDVLALTFDAETTKATVAGFIDVDEHIVNAGEKERTPRSTPTMHVAHPGVCTTTIMPLYWLMQQGYVLSIYLARWLGSPWAIGSTYTAAMSATWLALAPVTAIDAKEATFGSGRRVKWGTSATRLNVVSVQPTEVEGWGINGSGDAFRSSWWGGRYGRAPGAVDATMKDVLEFVALGRRLWTAMETLRREWEERIERVEKRTGVSK